MRVTRGRRDVDDCSQTFAVATSVVEALPWEGTLWLTQMTENDRDVYERRGTRMQEPERLTSIESCAESRANTRR